MEFSNDHVMWLAICLDNYTIEELSALQVIFFEASFLLLYPPFSFLKLVPSLNCNTINI